MKNAAAALIASTLLGVSPQVALAQCASDWSTEFGTAAGDGSAYAQTAFDYGAGTSMYFGGEFSRIGSTRSTNLARFDGLNWQPVGGLVGHQFGNTDFFVGALEVHDDGSGPELYVGGRFQRAGGQNAQNLARWNGTSWSPAPGGDGIEGTSVACIHSHPATTGNELIICGSMSVSTPSGLAVQIARWDGSQWNQMGAQPNGQVRGLESFDSGSGMDLYASGTFSQIGGVAASSMARWDGTSWFPLGAGLGAGSFVRALAVFDDGNGEQLYVAGDIQLAGGTVVSNIARWNGTAWSDVGGGSLDPLVDLQVYDDGSPGGSRLYASSAAVLRAWDGSSWESIDATDLGVAAVGGVLTVADYNDARGPLLHATLNEPDPPLSFGGPHRKLVFDGSRWDHLSDDRGLDSFGGGAAALSMTAHEGELIVGGRFEFAGQQALSSVARWNGHDWSGLGEGLGDDSDPAVVMALASFDDGSGSGEQVYAGGRIRNDGTGAGDLHFMVKFDGVAWTDVGGGTSFEVRALQVHDDGSGPALYAGGSFTAAGGASFDKIARWDGSGWSDVGGGFPAPSRVDALCTFDFGSGPRLVAAGHLSQASGAALNHIAVWDGLSWSALGAPDDEVHELHVGQHDGATKLFMGGEFIQVDGVFARGIAVWSGSGWSRMGFDAYEVESIGTLDGELFAGGGSIGTSYLSRWNGTDWSDLSWFGMESAPMVMHTFDDTSPSGPALFVGGYFDGVSPAPSFGIAKWSSVCDISTHCDTAPNSAGAGALISSDGYPGLAQNAFSLEVRDATPAQFGKFYYGPSAIQLPFGNGFRCVGGGGVGTFRLYPAGLTDSAGSISRHLDFTAPPADAGPGMIQAGSTYSFQFWYRDPLGPGGAGFNLSNALRVTFAP